jgi:hypothetical protein
VQGLRLALTPLYDFPHQLRVSIQMAQATVLLAAAPGLIEGVACRSGAPDAPIVRRVPAASASAAQDTTSGETLPAGLSALAEGANWPEGPAVIVVAADLIGFRRLSFPFNDPRRIRQALRFSLASELLDGVETYAVDHELILEGEAAHALVSFLKQDLLQELLAAAGQHALKPYRVVGAPHALLAAHPPASPDHIQIYVGAEEAFATVVRGGQMDQVQVLTSSLPAVLAELSQQGMSGPVDVHRLLSGEGDETRVNRSLLRSRLVAALEEVVDQIGHFLRVQALVPGTTLSLHGLYAPWIEVNLGKSQATLASGLRSAAASRAALGILEELYRAPERVLISKGPGFYRAAASWRSLITEVRGPAIALGVLIALLIVVSGTGYLMRTISLLRQLERTDREFQALVVQHIGANVPESARQSVLRERLQALRDQARLTSKAGTTPYAILGTFTDLSLQATQVPGITVESLQINGPQVVLSGQTPSYQAAEALRDRIASVSRFRTRAVKVTYQRAGQNLVYRVTVQ